MEHELAYLFGDPSEQRIVEVMLISINEGADAPSITFSVDGMERTVDIDMMGDRNPAMVLELYRENLTIGDTIRILWDDRPGAVTDALDVLHPRPMIDAITLAVLRNAQVDLEEVVKEARSNCMVATGLYDDNDFDVEVHDPDMIGRGIEKLGMRFRNGTALLSHLDFDGSDDGPTIEVNGDSIYVDRKAMLIDDFENAKGSKLGDVARIHEGSLLRGDEIVWSVTDAGCMTMIVLVSDETPLDEAVIDRRTIAMAA